MFGNEDQNQVGSEVIEILPEDLHLLAHKQEIKKLDYDNLFLFEFKFVPASFSRRPFFKDKIPNFKIISHNEELVYDFAESFLEDYLEETSDCDFCDCDCCRGDHLDFYDAELIKKTKVSVVAKEQLFLSEVFYATWNLRRAST